MPAPERSLAVADRDDVTDGRHSRWSDGRARCSPLRWLRIREPGRRWPEPGESTTRSKPARRASETRPLAGAASARARGARARRGEPRPSGPDSLCRDRSTCPGLTWRDAQLTRLDARSYVALALPNPPGDALSVSPAFTVYVLAGAEGAAAGIVTYGPTSRHFIRDLLDSGTDFIFSLSSSHCR